MANQLHRKNKIRVALSEGRIPIGIQCFSGNPSFIEIIGYAGFDFVMIDTEHACISNEQVETLCRVSDSVNLMPIVRVAENSPNMIRKVLEAGAKGIIIPRVRTADDVEKAFDAARYPPAGSRGMCPSTRAARYSTEAWDDYVRWTNEQLPIIPLIEHPEAIKNAKEICALPGVSIVLFGPGDLGMAMGFGSIGLANKKVNDSFEYLLDIASQTNTIVMGVPFPDISAEAARSLIKRGVRILLHSTDQLLFKKLCNEIISELQPVIGVPAVQVG
jgi:2-keto-3-deoxy-L-rhamnonate aldolase RhmA